jgi:pilus assembly protein Flp/PilA
VFLGTQQALKSAARRSGPLFVYKRRINFLVLGFTGHLGDYLMSTVRAFLRDEARATAIKYGLIAAGISVGIITTVHILGGSLVSTFASVFSALSG